MGCYKIFSDDRNIIIKKVGKGFCIVIWGSNDYLLEAEKQLSYKKVSNSGNILSKFDRMSNKMFSSLKKGYSAEKQINSFSYDFWQGLACWSSSQT